jgi:hypothetical protein
MDAETIDSFTRSKRVAIEPGTQLQIEIGGIHYRFKTAFVGMVPDEYLIIRTPSIPLHAPFGSIKYKLFPGNRILIRYLYTGKLFGFESKLIEAVFGAIKLLFIAYPKIIEDYDLRSEERLACFFPAKIGLKDQERHGVILDISRKGCRCLVKNQGDEKQLPVQIQDTVTLTFQLPGVEGEQVVSGEVKNITKDQQGMAFGVAFKGATSEIQQAIDQYISGMTEHDASA